MKNILPLPLVLLLITPAYSQTGLEFNRDIRPILSENCFSCHGPDPSARKGGLRLDREEGAKGKKNGIVIPGKPDESELFLRLNSTNPEEIMPPAKSGKKLTAREKALLRQWIASGAKWEGHWAYIPLKKFPLPQAQGAPAAFLANGIDHFIWEKLNQQGMKPSSKADRITLIRRLSFDLTGLPPQPEEVKAFVNDESPKAYENLVDRFLSSPHFGERMAVWWLDLVRYADSVGYHGDQPVTVWPYRDWVINAFNANLPFDQFTREQIAGDLLPNPTLDQKVAAGYNRLGMMSAEGGVQDKEYLAKYAAERVRNLGGTWLGTTMGCAECHDHKYDPFTMKDFYSLEAFFSDITERGLYGGSDFGPVMRLPTKVQQAELEALEKKVTQLKEKLNQPTKELAASQEKWEKSLASQFSWTVLKPAKAVSKGGAKLTTQAEGDVLVSGKKPDKDTYTLTVKPPKGKYTALKIEALPLASLPAGGSGRAGNGNFALTEITASFQGKPTTFIDPSATIEQTSHTENNPYKAWSVKAAIDGDEKGATWGWAILPEVNKPQHAVFQFKEDLQCDGEKELTITLAHNLGNGSHTMGHFRLAVTGAPKPVKAGQGQSLPPDILAILAKEKRNEGEQGKLATHYRSIAPELEATRKEAAEAEAKKNQLEKSLPTTLATISRAPRTIRLLPRGNWMDDSGPVQLPAAPSSLVSIPPNGKPRLDRLDLANWLSQGANPVTSRTLVNRLWKLYFGHGLSRKLDDMGSQGEWPTHPELLDWLALNLIENHWDLKKTIKLIVMSGAYQQSSIVNAAQMEKDQQNRWLGRQGRFRVDAEFIRDAYLSVSGLLVDRLGGPSVKPYQPPGYWAYLNFPTREWQKDQGEAVYRRGLYTHWQRQYLHPAMAAFDASCREECSPDRVRSNTPLQALALLNDPSAVEAARVFAEKVLREGGKTDQEKIRFAFQRATSRLPREVEQSALVSLLNNERKRMESQPERAKELLGVGDKTVNNDLEPKEFAAWIPVARALLNLHETNTRN